MCIMKTEDNYTCTIFCANKYCFQQIVHFCDLICLIIFVPESFSSNNLDDKFLNDKKNKCD